MKKKSNKKKAIKKVRAAKKVAAPKSKISLIPMGDRVLVKPIAQDTVTSFGIIIPDTAKEKPEQGVVVAVGQGRRGDDNDLIPVAVKPGDKVLFSKYGYDEVKVDGTEYYLLREDSILAILEK
jgi:chaperonin GroES